MRKMNILVGAFSVLFGLLILYLSKDMSMFDEYGVPGERFWPYGLASVIGVAPLRKDAAHNSSNHFKWLAHGIAGPAKNGGAERKLALQFVKLRVC